MRWVPLAAGQRYELTVRLDVADGWTIGDAGIPVAVLQIAVPEGITLEGEATRQHKSEFIDWSGFQSYPLPVQEGGVPIVIGGSKGKAFERIARLGNGWFAPTNDADSLAPMLERLRAARDEAGRD